MPKQPGWDDILPLWMHGRPGSTLYVYRPVIRGLRNFVQDRPFSQMDTKSIQEYLDKTSAHQLPATRHRKLATIRSLFGFAHRLGAIDRDPSIPLQMPRVPDELAQKILTRDEMMRLIEAPLEPRDRALTILLYSTGVRASEAGGLKWNDCRPRTSKDGQITVLGKGNKKRTIRLTPDVWAELMKLKPDDAAPEDFVFQSQSGWRRPLTRVAITNIVREAAKKAGLEQKVSAHWLRHAHATHAMDAGAPLPLISATLGHASLSTTSRYLHVNPEKSSTQYVSVVTNKQTKRKF